MEDVTEAWWWRGLVEQNDRGMGWWWWWNSEDDGRKSEGKKIVGYRDCIRKVGRREWRVEGERDDEGRKLRENNIWFMKKQHLP